MKESEIKRTRKVAQQAQQGKPVPHNDGRSPSQATLLVQLMEDAEYFHTADEEAFVTLPVNDVRQTLRLKDKAFRHLMERKFYETEGKAAHSQAVQSALGVLTGKALHEGAKLPVHTRLAEHDGFVYLDLANERWEAVEITPDGWHVTSKVPVKFRRAKGMLPLPTPEKGGTIDDLKPYINFESEKDFHLIVGWIASTLNPNGPYTVLALHGEQGSAKSSTQRIIRDLIDPNKAPLRSQPKDSRDLMIAAINGWILAYDNLSYISPAMSDNLCRLATGGGFTTRELYSDKDETIFDARRPVMLNAITEVASRADLLDRMLIVYLPRISSDKRKSERELWREFETVQPRLLGVLCDSVAAALRNLEQTELTSLPRMADFTQWVTASETAFGWEPRTFLTDYKNNRVDLNELALEASVISDSIRKLAERHGVLEGTAHELLQVLNEYHPDEDTRKNKSWPKNASAIGGELRRIAPNLRAVGIEIDFWRTSDTNRTRMMRVTKSGKSAVQTVQNARTRTTPDASDSQSATNSQTPSYSQFPLHDQPHEHEYARIENITGTHTRCKHCGDFLIKKKNDGVLDRKGKGGDG